MSTRIFLPAALSALALIPACGEAPEPVTPLYGAENLASSDACFSERRSTLLDDGQVLVERGPDGTDRVSFALSGTREDYVFPVAQLAPEAREQLNTAIADFYRAAGERHDVTTDAVIYHRAADGRFCTVMRGDATGEALGQAARAVAESLPTGQDSADSPLE